MIRFTSDYPVNGVEYKAGQARTFSASTEASLVAAKVAVLASEKEVSSTAASALKNDPNTGGVDASSSAALAASGVPVGPSRSGTNIFCRKDIGDAIGGSGTSTHQLRLFVPFGGEWVDVALQFINASTTVPTVISGARVAANPNFTDLNPSGAWTAYSSGLNIPVAAAAGQFNFSQTEWARIYVPEDAGVPGWGSIYARSKYTSGGWYSGINSATTYDTAASLLKSRNDFEAVAVDAAFVTPTTSSLIRTMSVLVRPVAALSAKSGAGFGDSRMSGRGSTSDYYGWAPQAAELICGSTSKPNYFSMENWGLLGTTTTTFMNRFNSRIRMGGLDFVHLQPASSNDTNAWTAGVIDTCISNLAAAKAECDRRGIVFVTETMYPSVTADTADKAAQWARMNAHVRANYQHYVENAESVLTSYNSSGLPILTPSLTADGQHRTMEAHALTASWAQTVYERALSI